jgi:hypothetical protein
MWKEVRAVLISRRHKIALLRAGRAALDAGEDVGFSCRFVERHKTGADELTLQRSDAPPKARDRKAPLEYF